jgi:hypothetical protein
LASHSSLRKNIAEAALRGHLGRTAAGGFKPVVEISYLHTMLDCGLPDAHHDAGGKSEITPFIFAEDAQGLGDCFVEALGTNLDRVLNALRIAAGDLAGADGHVPKLPSSSFVRHRSC